MDKKAVAPAADHRLDALCRERQHLLSVPPETAMERILDAPQPVALVHSFPEEDLYMLIQDIGPRDALPLLALASDRQIDFMVDLEIWDRDRIEPEASLRWLTLLGQADPARLTRWMMDHQTEFAEYYLFRNVAVRLREHDEDPSDFGDGFFTVDGTFYVRPLDVPGSDPDAEKQRKDLLVEMLRRMADRDHLKYQSLLLEAATVDPTEYEEEAYRLRNVRLAEKGFLPFEEAVGIYQPLTVTDFNARAENYSAAATTDTPSTPVPLYPSRVLSRKSLFAAALDQVRSADALDRIRLELAVLCNRIAVADWKTVGDRETLTAVADKAGGYLSIGLERIVGDDRSAGCPRTSALIEHRPLAEIFRVGYGSAQAMKWRAERWRKQSWFAHMGLPLAFWGEAWLGVLGGLLVKRPRFFDNYRTGVLYREFADLAEIRETGTVLDRIIAVDGLLAAMDIRVRPAAALSYKNLVLTLWARHYLGREAAPAPLDPAGFSRFFKDLWQGDGPPRGIRRAMKAHFLRWLTDRSGRTADEIAAELGPVLDDLFGEIAAELGAVSPADLDPRYIHLFLIQAAEPDSREPTTRNH